MTAFQKAAPQYNLTYREIEDFLVTCRENTVLVRGFMGNGKSALGYSVGDRTQMATCYVDGTTLDVGDIFIPDVQHIDDEKQAEVDGAVARQIVAILAKAFPDAAVADIAVANVEAEDKTKSTEDKPTGQYVRFVPNEAFGLHLNKPVVLVLDELTKASRPVQNALLRLLLERKLGSFQLHPDSIMFATGNVASEGVGDMMQPHARNRITILNMSNHTPETWLPWAINNNIHPAVCGFVREAPEVFQPFYEVSDPKQNEFIFHPLAPERESFVTGRSLEKASNILKQQHLLNDKVITAGLIGTIGTAAALELMAFVKLTHDLPKMDEIKASPKTAPVPSSVSAVCMVVYRALSTMEISWLGNWMVYLDRLPAEAQALFANGVRDKGYSKQSVVMVHDAWNNWVRNHQHLYGSEDAHMAGR